LEEKNSLRKIRAEKKKNPYYEPNDPPIYAAGSSTAPSPLGERERIRGLFAF
jgi:hypothetical protein